MGKNLSELFRAEICGQLKLARQAKGLSPAQVALETELSILQITQIEEGMNYSFKKYRSLAKYYGKKIKFVLTDI